MNSQIHQSCIFKPWELSVRFLACQTKKRTQQGLMWVRSLHIWRQSVYIVPKVAPSPFSQQLQPHSDTDHFISVHCYFLRAAERLPASCVCIPSKHSTSLYLLSSKNTDWTASLCRPQSAWWMRKVQLLLASMVPQFTASCELMSWAWSSGCNRSTHQSAGWTVQSLHW